MTVALVGLTAAETVEFEKLDNLTPLDEHGDPVMTLEQAWRTPRERRWLELYEKRTVVRRNRDRSRMRLLNGAVFDEIKNH
jgi:hypothetical protein